jgi:DNA-binding NarL/FixJ family response regulator
VTESMRVLLADDHPLFLDGLRNLLAAHAIDVVGTASDGETAVAQARALRPDIVLMDIDMPGMGGLAATRVLAAEMPEIKVVVLTMSASDEDLFEALASGAHGYLLKTQETSELISSLADVARGEIVLSPGLSNRVVREFARSPRDAADPRVQTRTRTPDSSETERKPPPRKR